MICCNVEHKVTMQPNSLESSKVWFQSQGMYSKGLPEAILRVKTSFFSWDKGYLTTTKRIFQMWKLKKGRA